MKIEHLTVTSQTLKIEREQLIDEGRDISSVEKEFDSLFKLKDSDLEEKQEELFSFLDRTAKLPYRSNYPYYEPSDLESIRLARPSNLLRSRAKTENRYDSETLHDRLLGAWQGRVSGCLLGKPVEGWSREDIREYIKGLSRESLDNYFRAADVPSVLAGKHEITSRRGFIDLVDRMVVDDDTNYTVAGMLIVKDKGRDFTPLDVARFWLENIPVLATWTAERTAYRNFLNGLEPPDSAKCRNPYREWIGAQIRADAYGYLVVGNPDLAAEFAWRDASVSHVKNGIYGSMWVAAMLAAAPFLKAPREVILSGLARIPENCRLAEAIKDVLAWHERELDYDSAAGEICRRWDQKNPHHWCHVIANAQIVALGLLWGGLDFGKSICRAVEVGFDTDCNGATVGSVVGMMLGAKALPRKWIAPFNNRLETSLPGYYSVEVDKLADECIRIILTFANK